MDPEMPYIIAEEDEIDWCIHHQEWHDGCKYCGPKPEKTEQLELGQK